MVMAAIVVAAIVFLRGDEDAWLCVDGEWARHGNPSAAKPEKPCINGEISNFEECVEAGYPIMESYPRKCRAEKGEIFTEEIGNELEKADLIKINSPRPNEAIGSPLIISGEARGYWFFEASFPVKLYNKEGVLLTQVVAQAGGDWMTEDFVPFSAVLEFSPAGATNGKLVLERDNPSGLPENDDQLWLPINFEKQISPPTKEQMTVRVYFNNNKMDPEFSCNKVFPLERTIAKTEAPARVAILYLLEGVTEDEKNNGYFTSINSGVKIQRLTIENGVAKIDFDEQMEYQMGGSCRVSAIRAQITETLKQFSTVEEVIISVNGRTEDILQP